MLAVVLTKIAVSLCVLGIGWLGARRLRGGTQAPQLAAVVSIMSRLVLDVSLPALAFTSILKTAPAAPSEAVLVPLLAFGGLSLAALCGVAIAWLTAQRERRRTLAFVIAVPNWIYLPLPIAAGLYGEVGTRTVLLGNVGALLWLWTAGVFLLSGQASARSALRAIASRPGLWATLGGIVASLLGPELPRSLTQPDAAVGFIGALPRVLFQALELLGTLTIPLALLVTGAQLAELRAKKSSGRSGGGRELAAALLGRLVLAPLLTFVVLRALPGVLSPPVRSTLAITAAMPVAVSCSMFTRELGGDDELAATAILASTLAALFTLPALLALWPQ